MTFTPNMIDAVVTFTFTPTDEWVAYVVPQGTMPVSMSDLGNGDIHLALSIRYDYGPFQILDPTSPTISQLADRLLIKAKPPSAELDYTERGTPIGTMVSGTEQWPVYVYIERDVMVFNRPDPITNRKLDTVPVQEFHQ